MSLNTLLRDKFHAKSATETCHDKRHPKRFTTAKRLPEVLGVDETQVIHLALHELATKFLPQYETDEGALTKAQLNQVKKSAPKAKGGTACSMLMNLTRLR
jgi:hypothetical protein